MRKSLIKLKKKYSVSVFARIYVAAYLHSLLKPLAFFWVLLILMDRASRYFLIAPVFFKMDILNVF